MRPTTGALWHAQANNPHYRVTELVVPAGMSTGLRRFGFKTIFLPHMSGQILVKSQNEERHIAIVSDRSIEFESEIEFEILNTTDQELRFTVMEFK